MKPYSKIILCIILATIFYFGITLWKTKPPPSNRYGAYSISHLPDTFTLNDSGKIKLIYK